MITIDLSTLNRVELGRLAKVARARGDGLLADRVDWEIATRADHGPGHGPPAFTLLAIAPGAEPSGFETEVDAEPPAFRPHHDEAPVGARGRWRKVSLTILGTFVGAAATAGSFWAADAFSRRELARQVDVIQSAPPAEELASRLVPLPADVPAEVLVAKPVARTAKVHSPKAAHTVRRTVKARQAPVEAWQAPVEDPDRLARLYESGMHELDAARAREDEPIY
jgi:hypothetical protein